MAEKKKRGPGRPPGSKNKKKETASRSDTAPKSKQDHIDEINAQIEKEKRTIDVIWSITLLAIGVFLLFTILMDSTGSFGTAIHNICLGLFGAMAYVLPFLFIVSAVLLFTRRLQHINALTTFFGIMIFFMLCILNSSRFIAENNLAYSFADIVKYYKFGVTGEKGGAVGMELGSLLVKGFGRPGLFIFAFAVLVISIFLVGRTPISNFFENMSIKRETKASLKALEEKEQEKVQTAVAATATPLADPSTGIIPQMNTSMSETLTSSIDPPRVISGGREVDLNDTIVQPFNDSSEPVKDNLNSNSGKLFGFIKRNTIFGKSDVENIDAGKYDSEKVGTALPEKTSRTGYGLGNDEDLGHSGSYGLAGYDDIDYSNVNGLGSRHCGLDNYSNYSYTNNSDFSDDTEVAPVKGPKRRVKTANAYNADIADNAVPSDNGAVIGTGAAVAASTFNKNAEKVNRPLADDAACDAVEKDISNNLQLNNDDSHYTLPPIHLLKKGSGSKQMMTEIQLESKADDLERTLKNFNVSAKVVSVMQGASVTRFEVQPAVGVKVSSITKLVDDIALNLRAKSIRIEAPIPGKAAVGIEIENEKPAPVVIRDVIESKEFEDSKSKISFVVGKDISGKNIVANLAEMPHLLIAGTTGSGKSVCINTIIASFLYKAKPSELKLIMIDPKVVELGNYNDIPHMLTPVVTDPRKASRALAVAVKEMDDRYDLFAKHHVKDLYSYNEYMRAENEPQNCKPEIVIIIDELADLMMAAPSEVENSICRLAQKARAAGMHLIVATQRPSVDVVTGLIKANIPSRIAFSVSSATDSRTILDMGGAEKLLGKGDMLFSPVGSNKPLRVQGPYISEAESSKIIDHVKRQGGQVVYDEQLQNAIENNDSGASGEPEDELTRDAIAFIFKQKQASTSMLQRRFRIGYNRAARIIDEIEAKGVIGPQDGSRPRKLLITEDEYYGEIFDETSESSEQYDDSLSNGVEAYESLPESVKRQVMNTDE